MNTCTLCGHGLTGDRALWTTCQPCQTRITDCLAEIETAWPLLSDCLEPSRGHSGPRVTRTADWTPPAVEQVLDLVGPMGVPHRLYVRYADLSLARRLQPQARPAGADATVARSLRGIRRHLPWAAQAVDLTQTHRELRTITEDLRRVTGGTRTHRIPCPAELPDGAACVGQLVYDDTTRAARCRACHTSLEPAQWLEVWVKLGQPGLV